MGRSSKVRMRGALLAATGIIVLMHPALAQAQDGLGSAESDHQQGGLGDIVVTARKRIELAQDVPISISTLSAQDIARTGAVRLSDALNTVPNVYFESNTLGGPTINIRGVSSSSNNFGIESAVGVYVDEVYLARPLAFDQSALDIKRIEVLRGPQGTLFGRNTIAGVLNITTEGPSEHFSAWGQATLGADNLRQFRGSLSGPLAEGLGIRLSAARTTRDGWFKQLTPGFPDFANQDTTAARAKLNYDSGGFHAALTYDYSLDRTASGNSKVVAGPFLAFDKFGPDESATNIPGNERRRLHIGSLKLVQELGDYSLTSVSAYQSIAYQRFNDQDYTRLAILATGAPEKDHFFSQELRLASPEKQSLTYLLGAYYSHGVIDGTTRAVLGSDTPGALGIGTIPGYTESVDTSSHIRSRSLAGFASATYRIGDRLIIAGGLRYTDEVRTLGYAQVVTPFLLAPGRPVGIIYSLAADVPALRQRGHDDALSGDASLTYKWSRNISVYLKFARGYKAGGFETTPAVSSNPGALSFKPEFVNLYEAGFKGFFADRRVRLNAAVFHMDYTDKQEQVFNGASFKTSNAGSARLTGAEAELVLAPTSAFSLNFNLGYTDATYSRYIDPLARTDYSGNRLSGSARWSGAVAANYSMPVAGTWQGQGHIEAAYRSRSFNTTDNAPEFATAAHTLVNGRVGIQRDDERYGIFVWGRNIFNKRYVINGFKFLGSTYVTRNRPSSWGVELDAKF